MTATTLTIWLIRRSSFDAFPNLFPQLNRAVDTQMLPTACLGNI